MQRSSHNHERTTKKMKSQVVTLASLLLLFTAPWYATAQEAPKEPVKEKSAKVVIKKGDKVIVNGETISDSAVEMALPEGTLKVNCTEEDGGQKECHIEVYGDREEEFAYSLGPFGSRALEFDFDGIGEGLVGRLAGSGLMQMTAEDRARRMEQRAKVAELDSKSRTLAMRARTAEGAEREALEEELQELLEEIFALKQEQRDAEIASLKERYERLVAERDERASERDAIIERRYHELLRRSLDW